MPYILLKKYPSTQLLWVEFVFIFFDQQISFAFDFEKCFKAWLLYKQSLRGTSNKKSSQFEPPTYSSKQIWKKNRQLRSVK